MSDNNTGNISGGNCNSSSSAMTSLPSTKRSHDAMQAKMEMKNDDTSNSNNDNGNVSTLGLRENENVCPDALFTNSVERLKLAREEFKAAQYGLALAQKQMEFARQKIRDSGNFEPDSLLFLCDGADNNILSCIMNYLAAEDVGRCEMVCSTLKEHATHHVWGTLDNVMFTNNPTLRSMSAESSREAVIRYTVASTLAQRIGDMKDSISRHMVVHKRLDESSYASTDARIDNDCEGCDFPNLNLDPFKRETRDEYELFVRFCRTSDNKLLAEGFCPHGIDIDAGLTKRKIPINIRNLDLSQWPQFVEFSRLVETSEGEEFFDNEHNNNMLEDCMGDLTVVVVGVHKGTSKASLAISQSKFDQEMGEVFEEETLTSNSIDCRPKGWMSAKSHGGITTTMHLDEWSVSYQNVLCSAKLGLNGENHVRTDEESGAILNKECHWTLDCLFLSP